MNEATYAFLSKVAYAYCCGKLTARQVRRYSRGLGYRINLREPDLIARDGKGGEWLLDY